MLSVSLAKLFLLGLLFGSVLTTLVHDDTNIAVPEQKENYFQTSARIRRSNLPPVDIERGEQLLNNFFQSLHSFVNETSFDHRRFRDEYTNLNAELNRVTTLVDRLRDPNHQLTHLMSFASQLFRVMRIAQENMVVAEMLDSQGPYYCLLYDTSELRVMTMDMLNDIGRAQYTGQQTQERIRRFLRRSAELEIEFNSFPFLPMSVRVPTWNDLMHSNRMLEGLRSRAWN